MVRPGSVSDLLAPDLASLADYCDREPWPCLVSVDRGCAERRRPQLSQLAYRVVSKQPVATCEAVTVGRDPRCDIYLEHRSVSRLHASFELDPWSARRIVSDCGSKNGSWIDGVRLASGNATRVSSGSRVLFGKLLFFFFEPRDMYTALSELGVISRQPAGRSR